MAAPKFKPGQTQTSGKSNSEVQVKRVAPYPISVQINKGEGQPFMHGQIVKMTEIGFLMQTDLTHFYKVSEIYNFYFQFPVINKEIRTPGVVVKTYDAMEIIGKSQTKMRTIEIHFKALSDSDRVHLNTYLVKSGQRK